MSNPLQKKKLCWNCEGRITLGTDNCPFCGVYLNPLTDEENPLFAPPYRMERNEVEEEAPPTYVGTAAANEIVPEIAPLEKAYSLSETMTILALLLTGAVFLLFGMALLLFSREGILTLTWDGTYWPLYLIVGVPFLGYGGYLLNKN